MTAQAPHAASLIGQHIGKYRILASLGQRGVGQIYEVAHDFIGHRAQVKILPAQLADDPKHDQYASRFLDEARVVNLIDDPSVITVFDFGERSDRSIYILAELVQGDLLSTRLSALAQLNQRLPLDKVQHFIRQVAGAMARVHEKGILHRDLQPNNVVLVADTNVPTGERAKILDFGLAKFLDSPERRTTCGVVMGAPTYLSPEQCSGNDKIDAAADVYALGVMFYEMLASRPPFSGDMRAMLRAHVSQEPPPLRQAAPQVPAPIAALVHQMLAKAPAERPTMNDVVSRLSMADQAKESQSRHNWALSIGLLVAGLLLGATLGYALSPKTSGAKGQIVRSSLIG